MNTIIDILSVLLIALIPACFSVFLDYCLGHPGENEPKHNRIFSSYTLFICERTIGRDARKGLKEKFSKMLSGSRQEKANAKQLYFLTVVSEAQKYFTFQQILGMCIYCTNFWLSVAFTLSVNQIICLNNQSFILSVPLLAHVLIKKL